MLRPYQHKLKNDVYERWNAGFRNVLAVSPTGSGKTVTMQSITDDCQGMTWSIAHRRELIGQISLAAAKVGVYHRIIAPEKVVRLIIALHTREFGQSFVHQNSNHFVASVQTINARIDELRQLIHQCRLWNMDEAHHIRASNIWGRTVNEFINAWGVGYTALAQRGDRLALGRHVIDEESGERAGGVFDALVIGPEIDELIALGHLVPFLIYGPQISSIDTSNVPVTASGDYSPAKLSEAASKSTITGDVVRDYLRFAPGKRGVTFCVNHREAEDQTAAFQQAGVPAEMITDKTPDDWRFQVMADLRTGLVKQVTNVDILGEGVDVPVLEVVSLARPTESEQTYRQQVGRVARPAEGKTHGIIIDHVKNVERHGPPNRPAMHTLEAPEKRKRSTLLDPDEVPMHTCPACWRLFESWQPTCIYCGHTPAPVLRDKPELVEGDLLLYTPDLLARITSEIERIKGPPKLPISAGPAAVASTRNLWTERQEAQADLCDAMAWWAGVQRDYFGRSDRECWIRFYRTFGIDSYSAQTLGGSQARLLYDKIWKDIGEDVDRHSIR
jgi:DNA repair protein RadD